MDANLQQKVKRQQKNESVVWKIVFTSQNTFPLIQASGKEFVTVFILFIDLMVNMTTHILPLKLHLYRRPVSGPFSFSLFMA